MAENTIINLKLLIVLHNYFKKGPNSVYIKPGKDVNSPKDILTSVNLLWKTILEEGLSSTKDKRRNIYSDQIIIEYSDLLLKKYNFMNRYLRIFEGNYSLSPFFTFPTKDVTPISAPVIEDVFKFADEVTTFSNMLLLNDHLWKI